MVSVAAILALATTSASAQQDATPEPDTTTQPATTEQQVTTEQPAAAEPEPPDGTDPSPTTSHGATAGAPGTTKAEPPAVVEPSPTTRPEPTADPDAPAATAPGRDSTSDQDAGAADDRRTALADAVAVEVGDNDLMLTADGTACATDEVEITFERIPAKQIVVGGYIDALEEPDPDTGTVATGIVTCGGDTSIVTGFDAMWEEGAWTVFVMPVDQHTLDRAFADAAEEAHRDHGHADDSDRATTESLDAPTSDPGNTTSRSTSRTTTSSLSGSGSAPVPVYPPNIATSPDPLAGYDGQDQCFSTIQPGTQALGDLITNTYPSNRSWYSLRNCGVGGRSEHKEGRALDWFVDAYDPEERALADRFTRWLTESDPYGNAYGGIRRMGLMYVVWNRQIWSSSRTQEGWRVYAGSSPHTDHVHISLSWAGANCTTTWWVATDCTGEVTAESTEPRADITGFTWRKEQVKGDYQPLAGDFNGDGYDDVLWYGAGDMRDGLWFGKAQGFDTSSVNIRGVYDPAVGDFDGNGYDDIIWYGPGSARDSIWWGGGGGWEVQRVHIDVDAIPVVGDFNANSRDEVLWYTPGRAPDKHWYWRDDRTTLVRTRSINGTYDPIVLDFNGFRGDDILWYGAGTAYDSLWINGSTGMPAIVERVSVNGVYEPVSGDFDNDGFGDVLWYGPGDAKDALWWSTGDGVRHGSADIDLEATPFAGDFNGAGSSDVFFHVPGPEVDPVAYGTP